MRQGTFFTKYFIGPMVIPLEYDPNTSKDIRYVIKLTTSAEH